MRLLFLLILSQFCYSQITFSPYITFVTDSYPKVVSIGDVNDDGLKDVVLGIGSYSTSQNNYSILVYIQNNIGQLNIPIRYYYPTTFTEITSIDIADLNEDGKMDIAISYDDKIGIFYQNSIGLLNPIIEIDTNLKVENLKIGDLNNDGKNDIAIATDYSANTIKVYYQTSSPGIFNYLSFSKPINTLKEIEIGDINNDNKNDLIYISSNPGKVHTYTQNDSGTLNAYTTYSCPSINGIGVGDLNNDGLNDIAVSVGGNSPNSKIGFLFQNQTTSILDNYTEIPSYDIPEPIEISDLNNDGYNEIITIHGGWSKMSIYQQNQEIYGQYNLYDIPYTSNNSPQGIDIGDINNDGKKDIVIAAHFIGLVVLYNDSILKIEENSTKQNVSIIYPNPIIDSFRIKNLTLESSTYEIYDINSKILLKGNIENLAPIDISTFQKGIYFLKIKTLQTQQIYKLIKE